MVDKIESPASGRRGYSDQRHANSVEQVNATSEGGANKGKMPTTFGETAPTLHARGYPTIPIKERGKAPGVGEWQNADYTLTQIQQLIDRGYANYGVGILTKHKPAVDIDVYDHETVEELASFIESKYPGAMYRIGQAPKRLYVFRIDKPIRKRFSKKYYDSLLDAHHRIEILGDGQQFVAFGIHPKTGKPYEWFNGSPLDTDALDLPVLTEELIQQLFDYFDELAQSKGWIDSERSNKDMKRNNPADNPFTGFATRLDISDEEINYYLDFIPADSYEIWKDICAALRHQFESDPERGFQIYNNWSAKSHKYVDEQDARKKWDSFKSAPENRYPLTFRSVIYLAIHEFDAPPHPNSIEHQKQYYRDTYIYVESLDAVYCLDRPAPNALVRRTSFIQSKSNEFFIVEV